MAVYPQLTTVRQSLSDMIEKAVEILVKPQTDNKNKIVILDHALVLRDSTGPALDTKKT
jgi:DNA-binding LacI/PurR family transcriptional regulator